MSDDERLEHMKDKLTGFGWPPQMDDFKYLIERLERAEAERNQPTEIALQSGAVWDELAILVGCTSPDGHAELDQVRQLKIDSERYKNLLSLTANAAVAEKTRLEARVEALEAAVREARELLRTAPIFLQSPELEVDWFDRREDWFAKVDS